MVVVRLSYEEFAKTAQQFPEDPLAPLVQQGKTVYVCALTRDLCSGCETQKPLYEKLADSISEKYGEQVNFSAIHVTQDMHFREKLQDFRRILRFAAYPTYLILLKAEFGTVEIYRGVEPPMEEIARNIDIAAELASR